MKAYLVGGADFLLLWGVLDAVPFQCDGLAFEEALSRGIFNDGDRIFYQKELADGLSPGARIGMTQTSARWVPLPSVREER